MNILNLCLWAAVALLGVSLSQTTVCQSDSKLLPRPLPAPVLSAISGSRPMAKGEPPTLFAGCRLSSTALPIPTDIRTRSPQNLALLKDWSLVFTQFPRARDVCYHRARLVHRRDHRAFSAAQLSNPRTARGEAPPPVPLEMHEAVNSRPMFGLGRKLLIELQGNRG